MGIDATAIEYGLIAALISVGIIAAATTLGDGLEELFSKANPPIVESVDGAQ